MSNQQKPRTGTRGAIAILALAGILGTSYGAQAATAGTTAGATINNMVKVEYFDANGKGLGGGTSAITKSSATTVTVNLLAAAPSISAPTPAGMTVDSGFTQDYVFKVWSNANGKDGYTFDVSALTTNTNLTFSERYVKSVTNAQSQETPTSSKPASVNFNIGAVTIIANTANSVTIPFGTMDANLIAAGDLVVINGTEYKVGAVTTAGSAAVYASGANTLTPEVPTTFTVTTTANASPNFGADALVGATLSQEYLVTVSVLATADPTQSSGTACFDDVIKTTVGNLSPAPVNVCTTFRSSNLTILKQADVPSAKPNETVTYTITVSLPAGAANSTKVKVTDAVPVYTTLKTAGGVFATVQKSTNGGTSFGTAVPLTSAADNTEDATTASGDATGTAANSPMTFYLGNGNAGTGATQGGTINANEVYKITYQVTIN